MTALLQLVYTADLQADQDTLNLLDYQFGFQLAENGWTPKVPVAGNDNLIETITLYIQATSQDLIAQALHTLDDWIERVNFSHEPSSKYQVWLRAKDTNESYSRQAMVLEMSGVLLEAHPAFNFDQRNSAGVYQVQPYVLTIRRTPFWEETAEYAATTTDINTLGGAAALSKSYAGDVPARIGRTIIENSSGGVLELTDVWYGFRSSRWGTLANFVPVWNLKDASYLKNIAHGDAFNDTVTAADATAKSGTKIVTDFTGGATMISRARISIDDITANEQDQRGQYTVLMRAKMSDTSVALTRIQDGYVNGVQRRNLPIVKVQGTSWLMYEMGNIHLPATAFLFPDFLIKNSAIILQAQRLSGAGNLQVDCFVLIPNAEGFVRIANTSIIQTGNIWALIQVRADGITQAYNSDGADRPADINRIAPLNYSIPANNEAPYVIVVAQRATAQDKDDTFAFRLSTFRRWRTLRGSET